VIVLLVLLVWSLDGGLVRLLVIVLAGRIEQDRDSGGQSRVSVVALDGDQPDVHHAGRMSASARRRSSRST
jgi:hypothetical protein